MDGEIKDIPRYFEEMRVLLGVVDKTKKEIDRLVAPDFNLFSILRSDEVRISNMIAILLNPNESHGQGNKFLLAFLDTLEGIATTNSAVEKIKIFGRLWTNSRNIKSEIEQSTGMIEASQRRMDILVSGEGYGLMIENKPWASDQKDQLKDYGKELEIRYGTRHTMIYLSGDGTPPDKSSITEKERNNLVERGELLVIAYRPHLINWLLRCLSIAEADRTRWVLKDFISYIEQSFPVSIPRKTEG